MSDLAMAKKDSPLCGCGGPAPGLFWDSGITLVSRFQMVCSHIKTRIVLFLFTKVESEEN